MPRARRKWSGLLTALLIVGALPGVVWGQTAGSPEERLQIWQGALVEFDYSTYLACLHSGSREVREYGSEEAMRFWADEMGDLRSEGFAGEFEIEPAPPLAGRIPPGAVQAFPIVDGVPLREAILLVQEGGDWKILRLFS